MGCLFVSRSSFIIELCLYLKNDRLDRIDTLNGVTTRNTRSGLLGYKEIIIIGLQVVIFTIICWTRYVAATIYSPCAHKYIASSVRVVKERKRVPHRSTLTMIISGPCIPTCARALCQIRWILCKTGIVCFVIMPMLITCKVTFVSTISKKTTFFVVFINIFSRIAVIILFYISSVFIISSANDNVVRVHTFKLEEEMEL